MPIEQISRTLGEVWQAHLAEPKKLMEDAGQALAQYTRDLATHLGQGHGHAGETRGDARQSPTSRFKDKDWVENSIFDFLKQVYLVTTKRAMKWWIRPTAWTRTPSRRPRSMSRTSPMPSRPPTTPLTNPEVIRATLATSGENLLKGMEKLETDLKKSNGRLRITQVDGTPFKLGENIATTPGKVVFRNDIFELIQFSPQVARTHEIPLLIVPPWINKYYILDLTPQKSYREVVRGKWPHGVHHVVGQCG